MIRSIRIGAILALVLPSTLFAAEPVVQKVTVRAVAHFGFDRTELDPRDRDRILAEVGRMSDVSWKSVTATGHTDSVGAPGYNARLSARRADVVKAYLVDKGLSPEMIATAARADEAPVAPNDDAAGRAQNRRTEVVFEGVRSSAR